MRWAAVAVIASLFISVAPAQADVSIDHREVSCVVAGKFPRFEARFDPGDAVARARLHFRPAGWPHWYSVPMKREGASFFGVLPKPEKGLQKLEYYISATDAGFQESRTPERTPAVVSGPGACQQNKVLALALKKAAQVIVNAPEGIANAPLVPAGFSTDGVIAGAAAGSGAPAAGAPGTAGTGAAAGGAAAAGAGGATAGAAAVGAAAAGGGISTAVLVVGGVAVAGGAAAVAVKSGGDEGRSVTIEGHVFVGPCNCIGRPGLAVGPPITGAVISTSLDSRSATTDASGYFLLETSTPCCLKFAPYTITITATGCQTFSQSHPWGDDARAQVFTLVCP